MKQLWKCAVAFPVILLALCRSASRLSANELPPVVPPPDGFSFRMPAVHRLPNGLRVVLIERHDVPIVRLYAIVQVGSEADPPQLPGLASMVAGLLPEGTEHRSAYQIAEEIDQAGGSIDTGAGWDQSYANVSVLSNHAQVAFDLLADLLIHPSFARDEVERLRKQTLSALDVIDQDPSYVADVVMRRLLFQGTPYAHSEDGTPESIERVTREDLLDFHRRYYVPSRTILAVAGDLTEPECLRLATQYLGEWNGSDTPPVQSFTGPRPLHSRSPTRCLAGPHQTGCLMSCARSTAWLTERRATSIATRGSGRG